MKKIFLLMILSGLFTDFGIAQEDTTLLRRPAEHRQSRITLLKDQILGKNYWQEEFRGNWAGIFIGVSDLAQTDYSNYPETEQDFFDPDLLRSYVIDINLLQFSQGLQRSRNTIGLVTGLGLGLQSWHLDNRTTIIEGPSRIEPLELTYDDPRKSKLISSYLSVPLLIEFQVPMKEYGNRLYFSAGVILSRRLSSHTKVKYTHEGKQYKLKSPDDYYMRGYHYTGTFRIGYRWINLYASYDLQPLFNGKKGPEAFPYSVGFALISF